MTALKSLVLSFTLFTSLIACSTSPKTLDHAQLPSASMPKSIEEAVANPARTAENKLRDIYRHPVETLKFFDIQPDQTVIEIFPSTGWYTEILAPLLAERGHYVFAAAKGKEDQKLLDWLSKNPAVASKITFADLVLPTSTEIAPPGTADRVLTFRNVHNWLARKNEKAAFAAFFKALKPGGILGVVEHRTAPDNKSDADGHHGYVPEQIVIALAEGAGFKFLEKSEINANPKDTKDYPDGVWTLPPTYRLKDQDRSRYSQIGESDRMTIKFVKPK